MKVVNKTKDTLLADSVVVADSITRKLLGLLFKKSSGGLVLHTRFGIHTFGMGFAIDVLVIDRENRVVALHSELRPWRVYFWNPKHSKVLELPAGTIANSGTELGDQLDFA